MATDEQQRDVPIPADVEREDRVIGPLTARQALIIAGAALVLWVVYEGIGRLVPALGFLIAVMPVIAVVVTVALGRREALSLDRWLGYGLRHLRSPKRLVNAPAQAVPGWVDPALRTGAAPLPAPLHYPAALDADGVLHLGEHKAVVASCSTVNFALRTPTEQHALVGAFAGWLHTLNAPAQVVVRTVRIDLRAHVDALRRQAPTLCDPSLEQAAIEHARHVEQLAGMRQVRTRTVLLVATTASSGQPVGLLDQATRGLGAAEVAVTAMDAAALSAALEDRR